MGCGGSPADAGVDSLHQILQVWEDMGVRLVSVVGHHLTIDDDIKLAVGAWCEFEVGDEFARPA